MDALKATPLNHLHRELGGKMVPFAGWEMPIQFAGILAEHNQCRESAVLFDVSHMAQVRLTGPDIAARLENLVCGNIQGLKPGRMRYTLFLDDQGGILDDLMVTHGGDHLFLVVNAACAQADIARLRAGLGTDAVQVMDAHALIALQGPKAAEALARLAPAAAELKFMGAAALDIDGVGCFVTRSGYTGEDGFEISVPAAAAEGLARRLLDQPEVAPAGLGARDSLRLEAGLCLYGHDIDASTTPVEADLAWTIGKPRREAADFPGAARVLAQLAQGPARKRVGLRPAGKAPVREGTEIIDGDGKVIGRVTSGGFGPTVGGPVAMGYVPADLAEPGTGIGINLRGRRIEAQVCAMPFVTQNYHRP